MLTFEMTSYQYFANISIPISPNNKNLDIFKIYTKWAVEKCPVQDGIPKPLRSREIQKTKVDTILRDTLYNSAETELCINYYLSTKIIRVVQSILVKPLQLLYWNRREFCCYWTWIQPDLAIDFGYCVPLLVWFITIQETSCPV